MVSKISLADPCWTFIPAVLPVCPALDSNVVRCTNDLTSQLTVTHSVTHSFENRTLKRSLSLSLFENRGEGILQTHFPTGSRYSLYIMNSQSVPERFAPSDTKRLFRSAAPQQCGSTVTWDCLHSQQTMAIMLPPVYGLHLLMQRWRLSFPQSRNPYVYMYIYVYRPEYCMNMMEPCWQRFS